MIKAQGRSKALQEVLNIPEAVIQRLKTESKIGVKDAG